MARQPQREPKWPEVSFTITYDHNKDAVSYGNLIESLRKAVTGKSSPTLYGAFRVLPDRVEDSKRFVLATLTSAGQPSSSIKVAIDVIDLYVVGYHTGNVSFFFKDIKIDKPPYNGLFTNTKPRNLLPFGGGYDELEKNVPHPSGEKINLGTIKLGIQELNFAIQQLSRTTTTGSQNFRARPLIVLIEMLSEATRFGYLEREVVKMIKESKSLPPSTFSLELYNKWGTLSGAIQHAIEGRFLKPVKLFGKTFYSIDAEIKDAVTVLKYISKSTYYASLVADLQTY